MFTLKKSAMKYKDANGVMQDVGVMCSVNETDTTLTKSGVAADAKISGEKFNKTNTDITDLNRQVKVERERIDNVETVTNEMNEKIIELENSNEDINVTAENITEALGYVPADQEDVNELNEKIEKPFEMVDGDTLTWDGNTEGLESVDIFGDGEMYYLVNEATPTNEEMSNGITFVMGSETHQLVAEEMVGNFYGLAPSGTEMYLVFVATVDNLTIGDTVISKKGIYICAYGDSVSLTIPGYTGFQTEKIKESYLPESIQQDITELNEKLVQLGDKFGETTQNIFDSSYLSKINGWSENNGVYSGTLESIHKAYYTSYGAYPFDDAFEENQQYVISFYAKITGNTTTGEGLKFIFKFTDGTSSILSVPNSTSEFTKFSNYTPNTKTIESIHFSYGSGGKNIVDIKNIQLEKGTVETEYITFFTAKDSIARKEIQNVTEDLSDFSNELEQLTDVQYELYDGYFNADGSISSAGDATKEKYTNRLFTGENKKTIKINLKLVNSGARWTAIFYWDKDGNPLSRTVLPIQEEIVITDVPNNAYWFALSFRTYGDFSLKINLISNCITQDVNRALNEVQHVKRNISNLGSNIPSEISSIKSSFPIVYETVKDIDKLIKHIGKGWLYDSNSAQFRFRIDAGITAYEYRCMPETEYRIGGFNLGATTHYAVFFMDDNLNVLDVITQGFVNDKKGNVIKTPKGCSILRYTARTMNDEDLTYQKLEIAQISNAKKLYQLDLDLAPMYFNADGSLGNGNNSEMHTTRIPVYENDILHYKLSFEETKPIWLSHVTYDENGNFIERIIDHNVSGTVVENEIVIPKGVGFVAFSYRSFGLSDIEVNMISYSPLNLIGKNTKTLIEVTDKVNKYTEGSEIFKNPLRFKPVYDHLFVDRTGERSTIPHESLYHVRLSRLMGYNTIEANVYSTSDGVYIVNHLSGGKFGGWFDHVDGVTNIADISVNSVTWDWIVQNVRYKSSVEKYRTRPCRLEEFLMECRQQNIIPFITSSDIKVVEMANAYMGEGNYIAYGASRKNCPHAVIYHWVAKNTKEEILEYCENIGKPFIYGMANPTQFSDDELKDIVSLLHSKGYWIGTSYNDSAWHKYSALGFDANGSQGRLNRISNGNICNLDSVFSYDDFTITGATNENGVLTFANDGIVTPKIDDNTYSFCGVDIQIEFIGTITLPKFGEHISVTSYYSNGSIPFFSAVPIINGSPKITINVSSGTVIKDISFKATKF